VIPADPELTWLCGQPKTNGEPCRMRADLGSPDCRIHGPAPVDTLRLRMWDMHRRGIAAGRELLAREQAQAAREAERAARWRLTERGLQVVQFGRYAYVWDGPPLKLGDRCLLPGNWLVADPMEAEVTGFGTDYDGTLAQVLRKIEEEATSDR
jgi:hypothetical protein